MSPSYNFFNLDAVDPSWHACLRAALDTMNPAYLQALQHNTQWLPGKDRIFSAFSIPVDQIHYVLFGESPYPRQVSANGYAFWDAAVSNLWSETGLSKLVNRATSLRHFIKMLLIADGLLDNKDPSQAHIAAIDKRHLIQTNTELFTHLLDHGFLLLNASLVLQSTPVKQDALAWRPFIQHVVDFLLQQQHRRRVTFILWGNVAKELGKMIQDPKIPKLCTEHPYNISFMHQPQVIEFFKPFHLLRA